MRGDLRDHSAAGHTSTSLPKNQTAPPAIRRRGGGWCTFVEVRPAFRCSCWNAGLPWRPLLEEGQELVDGELCGTDDRALGERTPPLGSEACVRAALSIDDIPELRQRPHQLGAANPWKVAHALMRTRDSSTSAATSMASSPKVSR